MRVVSCFTLGLLLLGCGGEPPAVIEVPRTVRVAVLAELSPEPPLKVTGVAEPYREADVSFEVAGRVTMILDVGRNVEVRKFMRSEAEVAAERAAAEKGPDGAPLEPIERFVQQGELMAQVDTTIYRQRLEAAELRLKTARSSLRATRIDAEEVAPAAVQRAKAQRDASLSDVEATRAMISSFQSSKDKAERDLERNRSLLRDKQISRAEFDQFQTIFDEALAVLARSKAALQTAQQQAAGFEAALTEAEASLRLRAETVGRSEAEIAELQVAVEQAQTELDRCSLRAPFSGRITRVLVSNGDYVQAGTPVLTLTLIDPIKIACTVSADRERELPPGKYARVVPEGLEKFGERMELVGTVFEKSAVADPTTRTFRVEVMVRNARRLLGKPNPEAAEVQFRELLPAVARFFGEGGGLFVCEDCVPPGTKSVFRVKGAKWGVPRGENLFSDELDLEEIGVEFAGSAERDFMQILNWSFRRVKPSGDGPELEQGDLLISFERLAREDIERGVVLNRFDWAIRPGEIVGVHFSGPAAPKGLWVPDAVIRAKGDQRSVYVVDDGVAREVSVTVSEESIGRLRRIEAPALKAGQQVVTRGVHYLYDGAPVRVVDVLSLEDAIEAQR